MQYDYPIVEEQIRKLTKATITWPMYPKLLSWTRDAPPGSLNQSPRVFAVAVALTKIVIAFATLAALELEVHDPCRVLVVANPRPNRSDEGLRIHFLVKTNQHKTIFVGSDSFDPITILFRTNS